MALPIALGYRLWQPRDLTAFRAYVVVVALLATAMFIAAGCYLASQRRSPQSPDDASASQRLVHGNSTSAGNSSVNNTNTSLARARHSVASDVELATVGASGEQTSIVVGNLGTEAAVSPGLCDFARQIVRHRNFWAFVFVNFLQVYQLSFQVRARSGFLYALSLLCLVCAWFELAWVQRQCATPAVGLVAFDTQCDTSMP